MTRLAMPQPGVPFAFLRKTGGSEPERAEGPLSESQASESRRIRCPLCDWQPRASSRWHCADCDAPEFFYEGCGTVWHTFETGGRCPGCGHQWRWTACLSCAGWSLHEAWYAGEAD